MDDEVVVLQDMGISHGDFFRIFPRVVAPLPVLRDGLRVTVEGHSGNRVQVILSEEKIRRIAQLGITYLELEFRFRGFSEAERRGFLGRFHRAFQKGGG